MKSQKSEILISEVLVGKIGLTEAQAKWAVKISDKYAVWIARQVAANPKIHPKQEDGIRKILSWKKKNPAVNLLKYDYASALSEAKKSDKLPFLQSHNSLKNKKVVAVCGKSEYKWVEINTKNDCVEEGLALKHCLKDGRGGYLNGGARVFSLRDRYNRPVLTLRLLGEMLTEYSASQNNRPSSEYGKFLAFLEEQAALKIDAVSKYERGIKTKLTSENIYDVIQSIVESYEDGSCNFEESKKKMLELKEDALEDGLKVDVSLEPLHKASPPEESLEYDDDGSIIC
jgi:hypothetical protein